MTSSIDSNSSSSSQGSDSSSSSSQDTSTSSSDSGSSSSSEEPVIPNTLAGLPDFDAVKDSLQLQINGYYPGANEADLKLMLAAGINRAIATSASIGGTSGLGHDYANLCTSNGIIDYPYIGSREAIQNDSALSSAWLGKTDSVKGVYMYDEPFPTTMDTLAARIPTFKRLLPGKEFLCCLMDPNVTDGSLWVGDDNVPYDDYINSYCDKILDVLGKSFPQTLMGDTYPLTYKNSVHEINKYHLQALSTWAQLAADRGYNTNVAIMAVDMEYWTTPTIADMRFQTNALMSFGIKGYSVFTVDTPPSGGETFRKAMLLNGEKTVIYDVVKQLNEENLAYDNVYLSFDWDGMFAYSPKTDPSDKADYTNEKNAFAGIETANKTRSHCSISDSNVLTDFSSDGYSLVGLFSDKKGNEAVSVMNYSMPSHESSETVSLSFDGYDHAFIYKNGQKFDVILSGSRLSLTLANGEGAFVIPYNL